MQHYTDNRHWFSKASLIKSLQNSKYIKTDVEGEKNT